MKDMHFNIAGRLKRFSIMQGMFFGITEPLDLSFNEAFWLLILSRFSQIKGVNYYISNVFLGVQTHHLLMEKANNMVAATPQSP